MPFTTFAAQSVKGIFFILTFKKLILNKRKLHFTSFFLHFTTFFSLVR